MRGKRLAVGIGLAAAAAIVLVLLMRQGLSPDAGGPPAAAPPSAEPAAPAVVEPSAGEALRVEPGQTLALHLAALSPGEPVALQLALGEPSRTGEPRPVRVIGPDGRMLEVEAKLGEGRLEARLELDPAWLSPGRYLVEVKTTERSHFPLRRYVLEIR